MKKQFDWPKKAERLNNQTKEYVKLAEMDMNDLVKQFGNDPGGEQDWRKAEAGRVTWLHGSS